MTVPDGMRRGAEAVFLKPREILFVTGATGYLGGHFLRLAVRQGWRVRCLTRRPPEAAAAAAAGVEWVKGDLLRPGPWGDKLRGCGVVVHLATHPLLECERDPTRGAAVIVGGMARLLRMVGAQRIRRLIVASSMEVYGLPVKLPVSERAPVNPRSLYGFFKACADLHVLRQESRMKLSVCILRFANLYGPAADGSFQPMVLRLFAERVRRGAPVILHQSLKNSRDFLHVRDAARALLLAVRRRPSAKVINVGTGRETTLKEAAQKLARLAGKRLRIDFRPHEGRLRWMRTDPRRARRELGFVPEVALDQGLKEVLGKREGDQGEMGGWGGIP